MLIHLSRSCSFLGLGINSPEQELQFCFTVLMFSFGHSVTNSHWERGVGCQWFEIPREEILLPLTTCTWWRCIRFQPKFPLNLFIFYFVSSSIYRSLPGWLCFVWGFFATLCFHSFSVQSFWSLVKQFSSSAWTLCSSRMRTELQQFPCGAAVSKFPGFNSRI